MNAKKNRAKVFVDAYATNCIMLVLMRFPFSIAGIVAMGRAVWEECTIGTKAMPPRLNPHLLIPIPSHESMRQEAIKQVLAETPISIQQGIVDKANAKRVRKALRKHGITPEQNAAWRANQRNAA